TCELKPHLERCGLLQAGEGEIATAMSFCDSPPCKGRDVYPVDEIFPLGHERPRDTSPHREAAHLKGWSKMTIEKPAVRPVNTHFSSGPCAKIPGWSPDLLTQALTGRSHRSSEGKARLKQAITLTREILEVPDSHLIGIVPAS